MTRLRLVPALLIIGLAASCAGRGTLTFAPDPTAAGCLEPVLVASSRQRDPDGPGFGRAPAPGLGFSRFTVSVPPDRAPGTVTFPANNTPDPRRDFLIVDSQVIADRAGFIRAVNASVAARPRKQREVFVFVHGFNTNFAEGLYRQAQMRHDFGSPGISVNYAWPSAANVAAYAADREATLQARDDLEDLLSLLDQTDATRIVVAGHSMGAFLVMEALRQKAIRNRPGAFDKIKTVVLMAPDIDVDVFRRQARALAEKDVSIYIFTSARDRALRFSALLRGPGVRLGALSDTARIADLPVTVIDLTAVTGTGDSLNHFKVATSPVMISVLSGMSAFGTEILSDEARQPGLLGAGVNVAQSTASVVLAPFGDP
ncbi:MAG: alpha/beta fold hydrolase [Rhodobacter sp.]|nr:alpha/beta fold hydrolase [Rhodobacter sp.]